MGMGAYFSQPIQQPQQSAGGSQSVDQTQPTQTPSYQSDNSGASDFVNTGLQGLFSNIGNLWNSNPVTSTIGNDISSLAHTGVGTFLGNALSTLQRGALSAASPVLGKVLNIDRPLPNYFDYSQNPGDLADKYFLGDTGNFATKLGLSIFTDPLTYLGGGEGDLAKVATSTGKEVGLTKQGIRALKDLSQQTLGHQDLVKLATENGGKDLEAMKQSIAKLGETTNPEYFSNGGIKFAGKTVIPQTAIDTAKAKIGELLTQNPLTQGVANSRFGQKVGDIAQSTKIAGQNLFDPKMTRFGKLTDSAYGYVKQLDNAKSVATTKMKDLVSSIFKGLSPAEMDQFGEVARNGLPTATGTLNRSDLVGKSLEELKQLNPHISENTLAAYHEYINNALPKLEKIAQEHYGLDTSHLADNYLHDSKTSRLTNRELYGSNRQGSKLVTKSGSTQAKIVSKGIADTARTEAQSKGLSFEETAKAVGDALRKAGFEDPNISTGRLAHSRFSDEQINTTIHNIVKNEGTKVDPKNIPQEWLDANGIKKATLKDAIRYYKEQGHGIYQPQGNLRFYKSVDDNSIKVSSKVPTYAVDPALASKLNTVRAGNAMKVNPIIQGLKGLSNNLLKYDFISPQFALVHGLWHLGMNSLLESGGKAFMEGEVSNAFNDVKNETPFFKLLKEKGALPHTTDRGTKDIASLIKEASNGSKAKQSFFHSIWDSVNPKNMTSDKWFSNRALMTEDNYLRTLITRNNIQNKGMSLNEAISRTNKFLVDYQNLTDAEKASLRLVMPFYAWSKGNLAAQTAAWLEHPWRQLVPAKVQDLLNQQFSGHDQAANEPGKQQSIDMGQDVSSGKENYLKVPLGANDLSGILDNPLSFVTNRFGQVPKALSVLTTGTDFGYPVVNQDSPTPVGVQKAIGIANDFLPMGIANPTFERKAFGIGLDPAQYPSQQPSSLGKRIINLSGISSSASDTTAQKQGISTYFQQKYLKSMRKKGL